MSRRLPPVRRAVPVRNHGVQHGQTLLSRCVDGRKAHLCGSGTQALAAAIIDAVQRRELTQSAEVIIPAYGCPDLVAACVFAGVRPRLVDIAQHAWGYDAVALRAATNSATAAIVAVNLLGIGDDVQSILSAVGSFGIPVIQDSAQFFPRSSQHAWPGQYVVLSFGRGKPVNLLGGGALVGELLHNRGPFCAPAHLRRFRRRLLDSIPAAVAFNTVTHPGVYALTARLPGLGVGATRYHPLQLIETWNDKAWHRVGAGLSAYLADTSQGGELWVATFDEMRNYGIVPLLAQTDCQWRDSLLRIPILAPDLASRDELAAALAARGVSTMYGKELSQIDGIPDFVREQGAFPNAAGLAHRLLTLPAHQFVASEDVDAVLTAMRRLTGR